MQTILISAGADVALDDHAPQAAVAATPSEPDADYFPSWCFCPADVNGFGNGTLREMAGRVRRTCARWIVQVASADVTDRMGD